MTTTPEREALAEEVKRLAGRYATHHRETYRHISSSSLPWVSLCAAIDALAASPAAGVPQPPDGYVLAPITPTQAMCQAGQWKAQEWPKFPLRISPIYQAMLAAATPPAAPAQPPHTEAPAAQDEREALTVLVAGATVYATNGSDVNRWWATVYPGFDDDGRKISQDECERIAAALAARAPRAACSNCAGKGYTDAWTLDGEYYPTHCEDCDGGKRASQAAATTPSEAVFAFAAWLTTRRDAVTFGAAHDASPAAELVQAFVQSQGFTPPREDYHHRLKPYPHEPAQAAPAPQPEAAGRHSRALELAGEMAERFEAHCGAGTWADPVYRQDAAMWAAAWRAATIRNSRTVDPTERSDQSVQRAAGGGAVQTVAPSYYEGMRHTLIVQLHELIDVAERYARHMHKRGDAEERDLIQGAIDYARKVSAPYNYNGRTPPVESVERDALQKVRECLEQANTMKGGPIRDTIWIGPGETLFDFIDAALAGHKEQQP